MRDKYSAGDCTVCLGADFGQRNPPQGLNVESNRVESSRGEASGQVAACRLSRLVRIARWMQNGGVDTSWTRPPVTLALFTHTNLTI
jgi:hypothetical protein